LILQPPPNAGFDTLTGEGDGKYNGMPGYHISFVLVDGGEPGTKDKAKYTISKGGVTVLDVGPAFLDKGNQQAHK
jgi:hypothetical protein